MVNGRSFAAGPPSRTPYLPLLAALTVMLELVGREGAPSIRLTVRAVAPDPTIVAVQTLLLPPPLQLVVYDDRLEASTTVA